MRQNQPRSQTQQWSGKSFGCPVHLQTDQCNQRKQYTIIIVSYDNDSQKVMKGLAVESMLRRKNQRQDCSSSSKKGNSLLMRGDKEKIIVQINVQTFKLVQVLINAYSQNFPNWL